MNNALLFARFYCHSFIFVECCLGKHSGYLKLVLFFWDWLLIQVKVGPEEPLILGSFVSTVPTHNFYPLLQASTLADGTITYSQLCKQRVGRSWLVLSWPRVVCSHRCTGQDSVQDLKCLELFACTVPCSLVSCHANPGHLDLSELQTVFLPVGPPGCVGSPLTGCWFGTSLQDVS